MILWTAIEGCEKPGCLGQRVEVGSGKRPKLTFVGKLDFDRGKLLRLRALDVRYEYKPQRHKSKPTYPFGLYCGNVVHGATVKKYLR